MDSPYLRGVADYWAGRAAPPFPKGNSSWAEKLYNRGWADARDEAAALRRKALTPSTAQQDAAK